jgi:hypothetical protein
VHPSVKSIDTARQARAPGISPPSSHSFTSSRPKNFAILIIQTKATPALGRIKNNVLAQKLEKLIEDNAASHARLGE